jgi:hypothetical protein
MRARTSSLLAGDSSSWTFFLAPHPTVHGCRQHSVGKSCEKKANEKALYNKVRRQQSDTSEKARGKT